MKRVLLFLGLSSLSMNGCTYTNAVSQTNIPLNRSKPIEASVDKFIFFNFNFDNDYTLQLASKLKKRCPQGDVRGITTQDKTTLYFLFIFWSREVTAKGYCQAHKTTAALEPEFGEVASSQE